MAINIDRINIELTFATSSQTAAEVTIPDYKVHGWAKTWKLTMPVFANTSANGTFSIIDKDNDELWASNSMSQDTTTIITGGEIPFVGGETLKLVLTAEPSGAGTSINVSASFVLYFVE
jgi:hypothetical protein